MSQMACIIHIHVFDSCLLYSVQVGSISNAASDISAKLMLSKIYIKINIRDWKRTIQIECQLICGNLQSGIFLDFIIDLLRQLLTLLGGHLADRLRPSNKSMVYSNTESKVVSSYSIIQDKKQVYP